MNQEYQEKFEQKVHQSIAEFLYSKGAIDNRLPEAFNNPINSIL